MNPQDVGLGVSIAILVLATAGFIVGNRAGGTSHPYARKLALLALWLLALLGLYSASAYLWSGSLTADALAVTRMLTVSVRTIVAILLLALLAYYLRVRR